MFASRPWKDGPEHTASRRRRGNEILSVYAIFRVSKRGVTMKTIKALTIILAAFGLLVLAAPAQAQRHGGGMHGGDFHHHHDFHHGDHVNFFFGGVGFPFFWGYPYWGYPSYYGYPYGYGYPPPGPYYGYAPQGVYQGRIANPPGSTNDGLGKDYSMVRRVQ